MYVRAQTGKTSLNHGPEQALQFGMKTGRLSKHSLYIETPTIKNK